MLFTLDTYQTDVVYSMYDQHYVDYSINHQSYIVYSKDTVSLRCLLYELIKLILLMEWTSIDQSILWFFTEWTHQT
jgi:hypothetical protein